MSHEKKWLNSRLFRLASRIAVVLLAPTLASAEAVQGLPTSSFATAPLVTPDQAFTYFDAAGTTRTSSQNLLGTDLHPGRSEEIKALAVGLGKDDLTAGRITQDDYAQRAFEYVRFNLETTFNFGLAKGAHGALIDQSGSAFDVAFVPIYGLQKGAAGALQDESGTAFDRAQLMVGLLREADRVAAWGYKLGTITLNGTQFNDWFGISNADVARRETLTISNSGLQ